LTVLHKINATENVTIVFEQEDEETGHILQSVCKATSDILQEKWYLHPPPGTQVHVMRSWMHFPFNASFLPRKILLALTFPFWATRAKKLWAFTGGWTLPYTHRPAVGVKPLSLLQASDRSLGRQIFVDTMDDEQKIKMITCHELTHASTAPLKLPAWLNEGLAMIAVDGYFGYSTVQAETLSSVKNTQPKISPRSYRQLHRADTDALVYLYVRGYWITRFFHQRYLEALRTILSTRRKHSTLLNMLGELLQLNENDFWQRIDDVVVDYFTNA
jgi:hypothetical protein